MFALLMNSSLDNQQFFRKQNERRVQNLRTFTVTWVNVVTGVSALI